MAKESSGGKESAHFHIEENDVEMNIQSIGVVGGLIAP
jgi:hypothetical protein